MSCHIISHHICIYIWLYIYTLNHTKCLGHETSTSLVSSIHFGQFPNGTSSWHHSGGYQKNAYTSVHWRVHSLILRVKGVFQSSQAFRTTSSYNFKTLPGPTSPGSLQTASCPHPKQNSDRNRLTTQKMGGWRLKKIYTILPKIPAPFLGGIFMKFYENCISRFVSGHCDHRCPTVPGVHLRSINPIKLRVCHNHLKQP